MDEGKNPIYFLKLTTGDILMSEVLSKDNGIWSLRNPCSLGVNESGNACLYAYLVLFGEVISVNQQHIVTFAEADVKNSHTYRSQFSKIYTPPEPSKKLIV
jgi:hypothetical protein